MRPAAPRAWPLAAALLAPPLLLLVAPAAPAGAAGDAGALASPTALPLNDVAFRRDGALALAVGGAPGQGVVLRVAGGEASLAREDQQRWLAVAWSPASEEALLAGDGGVLRTADGQGFEALALPEGLERFDGRAVAWKPDGSEALVAGSALLRYRPSNQSLELLRAREGEWYGAAAWKPDGSLALLEQAKLQGEAWVTGRLLAFDGQSLAHVATYGSGRGLVEAIAWEPRGAWALVVGHDAATGQGPAMRWDGSSLTAAFAKPEDRFTGIAWRPGAAEALLTGASGERLARTTGQGYDVLLDEGPDLLAAAWQPGGARALLVGLGGALLEWLPDGRPLLRVLAPLPGAVLAGTAELAVRAEPRPGAQLQAVEFRLDAGPWQPMGPPVEGERVWRASLDAAGLAEGPHALEFRARDAGAVSQAARVDVRVARGAPPAPRFLEPPARDADGVVTLAWSDAGADAYELEGAREPGFAEPALLARTSATRATVLLAESGAHHLRVRALLGPFASAWSEPARVEVMLEESPFPPAQPGGAGGAAAEGGAAAGPAEPARAVPGPSPAVAVAAVAALGLALQRRR